MTKLNKYCVILLLSLLCSEVIGQSRIDISIDNAENPFIIVDDTLSYNGSRISLHLEEGVHIISLFANRFEWTSVNFIDTIIVEENKLTTTLIKANRAKITNDSISIKLFYSLPKNILVKTIPEDVYVYKGDKLIGHTPFLLEDINIRKLDFRKPSYQTIESSAEELTKIIKLKYIGDNRKRSFAESYWFPVLLGTAAVLGGVSAYFKTEADKKYDEYLNKRNQLLLDETNRLDLFSGVTLGLLEVNLAYIIYQLLSE